MKNYTQIHHLNTFLLNVCHVQYFPFFFYRDGYKYVDKTGLMSVSTPIMVLKDRTSR